VNECGDVLVVDDDVDMLEVIELVLREAGYPTRTALNGRQALDAVARSMPALIVLDMLMPVMNGWQFAREFRARYGRDVPIVVATAAEHVNSRGDAIDASDVLPKPFEVSDLLRLVARHVAPPPPPGVPPVAGVPPADLH
jgi:CheY-like chemotaxis protein